MLVKLSLCLRCFRLDGGAIGTDEFSRVVPASAYPVDGCGEDERSVNLIGCSLSIDSFKGRGASQRFAEAARAEVEGFASFLSSIDAAPFEAFLAGGSAADLLVKFSIDDNAMDFELPRALVSAAARLAIPITIVADPE
jgi:hypothetical protein